MKNIVLFSLLFVFLNVFGEQEYWVNGITGELTDEKLPDNLPDVGSAPTHLIPSDLGFFEAIQWNLEQQYRKQISQLESDLAKVQAEKENLSEKVQELQSENASKCGTFIDGWFYLDKIGWSYTTPVIYPYFYRFTTNSWYYHHKVDDSDDVVVYSYKENTWTYLYK